MKLFDVAARTLAAGLLFTAIPAIAQTPFEIVSSDGSCLQRVNESGFAAGFSLTLAPCTREEEQTFHVADPQSFWDMPFRYNGGGTVPVSNYLGAPTHRKWPYGYLYLRITPTEKAGEDVFVGKLSTVTFKIRDNLSQIASDTGARATFTPNNTQEVLFGANGAYVGRTDFTALQTGNNKIVNCNSSSFGADPAPGTPKSCFVWNNVSPGDWIWRAKENSSFNVSDSQLVRYGAAGRFNYRTFPPGKAVSCSSASFGDPIPGTPKNCYVGPTSVTMASAESGSPICLTNPGIESTAGGANAIALVRHGPCDGSARSVWKLRPIQ